MSGTTHDFLIRRAITILAMWLCLVAQPVHGQPPGGSSRIALLPAELLNLGRTEAGPWMDHATAILKKVPGVEVLPRRETASALARTGAKGCASRIPCLQKLGRSLGARKVLALRFGRLGDTLVLRLTAFDVARGVRQGSWQEVLKWGGSANVRRAVERLVHGFAPPAPAPRSRPWFKRWYVWTVAGLVVAGSVTAAVLATRDWGSEPDHVIRPP